MRPEFGRITRVLGAVLIIAGVGGIRVWVPGETLITDLMKAWAIACIVVGIALWMDLLWAWWAGLALTLVVVVLSIPAQAIGGAWFVWVGCLCGFAVSAMRGRGSGPGAVHHAAGAHDES